MYAFFTTSLAGAWAKANHGLSSKPKRQNLKVIGNY
jgi:hypothetical protein